MTCFAAFVLVLSVFSCRVATMPRRSGNDLQALTAHMLKLVDMTSRPHLTDAASPVPDYMTALYRDIDNAENNLQTPHSGSVWGLLSRAESHSHHHATLSFRSQGIVANRVTKVELVYPQLRHSGRSRYSIQVCEDDDNTACVPVHGVHRRRFHGKTEVFDVHNVTDAFVRWSTIHGTTNERNDSFILRLGRGRGSRPRTTGGALLVVYQDIAPTFHSSWSVPSASRTRRSFGNANPLSASQAHANSNRLQASDCQLHPWYVHFSRVGWNDWILDPKGYTANFCRGECADPVMNSNLNATNHSFIKSLYRARVGIHNTADIPSAHCVPTRLSPINLLFKREDKTIVIRHLVEMVADSCGCM